MSSIYQQLNLSYFALEEKIQDMMNTSSSTALLRISSALEERIQDVNTSTQQLNMTTKLLVSALDPRRGLDSSSPTFSCNALNPNSPSGFYWIVPVTGPPAVQVYCDFDRQCRCDGPGTWTRVAFLNMSDTNQVCPSNWTTYTTPIRACGNGGSNSERCESVIYPTFGITYSRVCGRVIANQHGDTRAFSRLTFLSNTIDSYYLDGVSLTHGSVGSRQHIWSFAI